MRVVLIIFLLAKTFNAVGQCNFESLPGSNEAKIKYAVTKTSIGKFMIGKDQGNVVLAYYPMNIMAISTSPNNTSLKLDSAIFVFEDYTTLSISIKGVATAVNTPQLKPVLTNPFFGITLNEEQIKIFKSKLITAMQLKGELNSQGGDYLNEKQRLIFKKSFSCIE